MLMPRPKKRAHYVMVEENDPQWLRFWNAYPKRVSKKEARKAWAKVNPTPETVDRMVAALKWQVPLHRWDTEKYQFAPYPASWLNDNRWEDDPPPQATRVMSDAAALVFQTLNMEAKP